jgi:Bacterial membrane protein YfhO
MSETTETRAFNFFTPLRFGILLAALIFAAFPQVLLGLQTFVARDYGFFAYPLAHFQRDCFWRGEIPFWDPYNNCGVPFLAQWNTMPLYPPSLIYLLPPLNWSLSFFDLLHLWFAGFGMFFLARRWTGNSFAAAFAGTVFSFNGLALNLLMWPSHVATFSWMPWVIFAAEMAWREGGGKIILAATAGALQMLAGGPETIFLTWLLVLALWIQQFAANEFPRKTFWRFPLVVALVIALSAAQLLPFLDLVAHAQRETGYTDLRWSMPASGLANFIVPMAFGSTVTEGIFFQHGQYWTSSYYLGLGTLWLAALAPVCVRERRVWLLAAIVVVGLLCALGENTPFYPLLRRFIPQLSFITYPVKYVTVVIFAAPLLAAFALANFSKVKKWILPSGAILFLLLGGILFWTRHFPKSGDDTHATLLNGFSRAAFLILTGAVLFLLGLKNKSPLLRFAPLFLTLVAWLDVFTHEPPQNPTVAPNVVYESNLARAKLAMNPQPELGGSRAMVSPKAFMDSVNFALNDPKNNFLAKRLGYCANVNLLDAVPKVDGFFSLTPRESDEVLSLFYTRTNASCPRLEDFMGVSQITAPDQFYHWQARADFLPLVTAGQKPFFLADTNALFAFMRNAFEGDKIVFLPPEAKSFVTVSNRAAANILNSNFKTQSADIEVSADAPALVVVAQTYYHDWRAKIDGRPAKLLRANVAFQAVQIPEGDHKIHLFYQDRAFEIGAAISCAAWLGCLLCLLLRKMFV